MGNRSNRKKVLAAPVHHLSTLKRPLKNAFPFGQYHRGLTTFIYIYVSFFADVAFISQFHVFYYFPGLYLYFCVAQNQNKNKGLQGQKTAAGPRGLPRGVRAPRAKGPKRPKGPTGWRAQRGQGPKGPRGGRCGTNNQKDQKIHSNVEMTACYLSPPA